MLSGQGRYISQVSEARAGSGQGEARTACMAVCGVVLARQMGLARLSGASGGSVEILLHGREYLG